MPHNHIPHSVIASELCEAISSHQKETLQPSYMEFHISRTSRDLYRFDESIFSFNGNVIFANFHAARLFAQKMNARRDLVNFPERAVRAGQINAMGLIDEILHLVVEAYRRELNPGVMEKALAWLAGQVGEDKIDLALRQFARDFPPLAVYRQETDLDQYLAGESTRADGAVVPNRQIVLEEMLMLWLANANPAFAPYLELFDDADLEKNSAYPQIIDGLRAFFDTQPFYGPDHQNLIDVLRAPALASPHSLTGQLDFIRSRWATIMGSYLFRLLSSMDLIREEEKIIFGVGGGGGPMPVIEFRGLEVEPERFSPDRDWMPNLVLMAKNAYVWLDQLSKKYKLPISRLDQIPDEELDALGRWGITGLWLIGLWERSMASRTVKQLRGNPDAVASAYSLFGYDIAADLGGDESYRILRDRAWKRGIRLASDMVPNHMGIDSRWVVEHPDWFVALDYSPFPSYSFNGPNLSWDNRVGIYLEDHYYNNSDAAVVFKRADFWTGSEKYIYHGNDGTSMPWNDTAQLNYLLPEVREAVIQTILHVARKFPIIRFDAAMTLAKRHYQRLWFPEPGSGGDIPSRSEYGLTKEQFDAAFPQEFWREVVDRVAAEAPDTLLLAEAFWLMEGYFVRTLGMHRVYNSAFMNMLRDEKNQEYRLVIKNTLEFEPEILKRYVNFMNNPDERTAVDQFGKGDKYFGISTMLATLPGLPMFGHGQVEGFTEKYGMEYRRAYWEERPDGYLVERHEGEIFPLLRRRYLFAEAHDFLLYDFSTPEGYVNEDVFAYSNRAGDERALVIYQNKYASTRGWIHTSTPHPFKTGQGDERVAVRMSLGEGLGLRDDSNWYTILRDHTTGLEYLRNNHELHSQGLYVELDAYEYHVFLDFRQVEDNAWRQYAGLAAYLNGGGVPSIDEALQEIFLQPVHSQYRELINAGYFQWLIEHNRCQADQDSQLAELKPVLEEANNKLLNLLREAKNLSGSPADENVLSAEIHADLASVMSLPLLTPDLMPPPGGEPMPCRFAMRRALKYLETGPGLTVPLAGDDPTAWSTLYAWLFTRKLGKLLAEQNYAEQSRSWIDEWLLGKIIANALQDLKLSAEASWRQVTLVKLLTSYQSWASASENKRLNAYAILQSWLKDEGVQAFINVNRYQGVLWFNQEAFEEMLWWLFVAAIVDKLPAHIDPQAKDLAVDWQGLWDAISPSFEIIEKLLGAETISDYQVEKLLEAVKA